MCNNKHKTILTKVNCIKLKYTPESQFRVTYSSNPVCDNNSFLDFEFLLQDIVVFVILKIC